MADNLEALELLDRLVSGDRSATPEERAVLERWHGWGAAGQLFDRPEFADERERLQVLLGPDGYRAAARTTLNAHYTDARLVRPMWQALTDAGVGGGVVLEPGAGRGSFVAEAPAGYRVLAIELDPATARVAAMLADGRHHIVQGDFAELQLVRGADAMVGNVPFGNYRLFDPEHNPGRRLSIHDHFIAKSAAALRPGGVAVVITSRFTLDKLDGAARRAIGQHADFVGAVRLPGEAHRAEAGTKVVTDILVLRGRSADEAPNHAPGWDDHPVQITEWQGEALAEPVRVSRYWVDNPGQVLGTVRVGGGMYQGDLVVDGDVADLELRLARALTPVAQRAGRSAATAHGVAEPADLIRVDRAVALGPYGRIERTETGVFRQVGAEGWEPHRPPATQRAELAALIEMRDLAENLVALEANPDTPTAVADDVRTQARVAWERYVARYGPLNRVRVNEETGRRQYPEMGGFRSDPGWPRVAALEIHDQQAGTTAPAAILLNRIVQDAQVPERVEDPGDALALSLGQRGRVDVDYIAQLLDADPEAALTALSDRVYLDPAAQRWVPTEEYLSGDVRTKLREAQAAARLDGPTFDRNVTALGAVIPRDVTADELVGTLGAPWLPVDLVEGFARSLSPNEELGANISVAYDATAGAWSISAPSNVTYRMRADHEFGLAGFDALRLLECGLNGRAPVVTKPGDPKPVLDVDATAQAVELAVDLGERFDNWLLREDPERSARALGIFNERFNSHVPRSYETAAAALNTEGLRSDFVLRPHQRTAIARMVSGGSTLLAHPVGAGKTAEMIVGAMSLKRLGVVQRPCFVVPNHMLSQFAGDIVALYPGASVLTINKDQFNKQGRETFAARTRSHDWDAVVITHASFTKWPLSPGEEASRLETKLSRFDEQLQRLQGLDGAAAETLTKKLEKRKANYEERLKEAQASREQMRDDHTFYFDQAGIDYLLVDEAHEFKNAEITSQARNLRGVPTGPAVAKTDDLDSKLAWLRDAHPGRAVVTFATATPISNTAAELWVMGRYLRPELLDKVGIGAFDSFRLAFCDTVSAMELDVSGTTFRRIERLSRYKNLPELARIWSDFVDVVTLDQLDLPRPSLAGGQRAIVAVPRSPQLEEFMTIEVVDRADAVRGGNVEPEDDNHLKITTDARLASFDWETFRGEPVDPAYSTLVAAADRIAAVYHDNADRTYQAGGGPHPRPGAFQLVFSDLGTPKPGRNDTAYDRFRALLVARGVPPAQVGFIHENDKDDEAKARFFAACRDGRIAVAVASTPKMGMGTNVQDRLLALHHLDCPWRASDIEQREGRALRQGNQNPEVQIYAYVTERSFSVAGWQTVERKAGFVGQVMRADPNGPRVLEPDDEEALSFGQIKAIATGDPDFLRLAELDDDVARLERLQRGHHQEQAALVRRQGGIEYRISETSDAIARLRPLVTVIAAIPDEQPLTMKVRGYLQDNRGDAARALAGSINQDQPAQSVIVIGIGTDAPSLGVDWSPFADGGRFELRALNISVPIEDTSHDSLVGAVTRIINGVRAQPGRVHYFEHELLPDLRDQLERTEAARNAPLPRAAELKAARQQATQLRAILEQRYAAKDDRPPPTSPDTGAATPAPGATPEPDQDAARHLADAARMVASRPATPDQPSTTSPPDELPPARTAPRPEIER